MKTYNVSLAYTVRKTIKVQAENIKEAIGKAETKIYDGGSGYDIGDSHKEQAYNPVFKEAIEEN
jgi:hypothetical protein